MEPIIHTNTYETWAPVVARYLLAIQIGVGAYLKVVAFPMMVGAAASVGLPFPNVAVALAFILELAGVLALVFGYRVRFIAMLLAAYVALLAVLFYRDFGANPNNFGMFMSHLGLIAALLYVSVYGAKTVAIRKD
jgi:putative oxidoreductase